MPLSLNPTPRRTPHVLWRVSGKRAPFSPPSVTCPADPRRASRDERRTGDACSRKRATGSQAQRGPARFKQGVGPMHPGPERLPRQSVTVP